jgi:UDP-3-O-acyl-N-acetylglucosamine deacetylase
MDRTIILLADNWRCKEEFVEHLDLPLFYMGDFSLLGIVVDDVAAAGHILRQAGHKVLDKNGAADIFFHGPQQLPTLIEVLHKGGVHAELRDIAETLYQA